MTKKTPKSKTTAKKLSPKTEAKKSPSKSSTEPVAAPEPTLESGPEHRKAQRVPVQLLVDYRADGHYLFDFCRDLGTGGVFIQTDAPLDVGTTLDLVFTLPDSKETLTTKGEIIWKQEPIKSKPNLVAGMGVQFRRFDKEQKKVLDRFIERNNENASSPKIKNLADHGNQKQSA